MDNINPQFNRPDQFTISIYPVSLASTYISLNRKKINFKKISRGDKPFENKFSFGLSEVLIDIVQEFTYNMSVFFNSLKKFFQLHKFGII